MKKPLILITIAALAAGAAYAQPGQRRGQMRDHRAAEDCDLTGPGPRAGNAMRGHDHRGHDQRNANRNKRGGPMSDELRKDIRAQHQAIRDLVGAARVETDDAKKAVLVEQLRTKLGAIADRVQAHQKERLAQAEERLTSLKERIAETDANRDTLIDEQIERLLAGERPGRPAAFADFPYAKGARRGRKAPPCGDDMPEDMPPPPAE
ncbi:MAG: hypothetical protein PHO14_05825 [Kiritimatiellae bacterium]|nr:hypothetical protein [Kiritimatiellia bacterium]MDD4341736.1 hypothetical protein [Kiritimatiellia bacterium]